MRQVPCFLIIGRGRLARHFIHYFSYLKIPVLNWYRGQDLAQLSVLAEQASHIWVLINDAAIESFIQENLQAQQAFMIHCSGSLITELAFGVHPLMTFSDELYAVEDYSTIPLVLDDGCPDVAELLPGLTNPVCYISLEKKPLYHALCVMSGNFSCLLWQKIMTEFSEQFAWPKEMVFPYMQQQMLNLLQNPENALTGPLMRHDQVTLDKNIQALQGDAFQAVYQAFVKAYQMKSNEVEKCQF